MKRNRTSGALTKRLDTTNPVFALILLFLAASAIRYGLTCLTSNGPFAFIDEGLYINIARGLFYNGEITYRAQPVSYVYLVYPVVLMPLFLLPSTVDLFRAAQLLNILLMTSAIFPAYLLARKMRLSRAAAYIATLFLLCMPDLFMSSYMMSECLIYPLSMWLSYFAFKMIRGEKPLLSGLTVSLFTVLTYFTKPGYVVYGATLLLISLAFALRGRDKKGILRALICLLSGAALIGLWYFLYARLFRTQTSLLTLYEDHVPKFTFTNLMVLTQGILLHGILFLFSGLGLLTLMPALGLKTFGADKRQFLVGILFSIAFHIIGVAFMIVLYEWRGSWLCDRVHLRYLAFYLPILVLFILSPELEKWKPAKGGLIAMSVSLLTFLFPNAYLGFTKDSTIFDSMSISAFCIKFIDRSFGVLVLVLCTTAIGILIYKLKSSGFTAAIRKAFLYCLTAFMLINACCVCVIRYTTQKDDLYAVDANALVQMLPNEQALMITQNNYRDGYGFQADVRLRRPTQYVTMNNMLFNAYESGGQYVPFTPWLNVPNTASRETAATNLLVLDVMVSPYIELSPSVKVQSTPNRQYTLMRIDPDQPWVRTGILGMDEKTMKAGGNNSLILYDTDILFRNSVLAHIYMRSDEDKDTVTFQTKLGDVTVSITDRLQWYTIALPLTGDGNMVMIPIKSEHDIVIEEYRTE